MPNVLHNPQRSRRERLLMWGGALLLATLCASGCAQRAQLSPLHAQSYKTIFSAQAVAPDGKLVATTAEDAKEILKRRKKMKSDAVSGSSSSSRVMSRAASRFALGGR